MDVKKLNEALVLLAEKKNELSRLSYSDKIYDDVEEELHDMEDELMDEFGDYLEDVIGDVHEQVCPESDVLLPTAYLANKYDKTGDTEDGMPVYEASNKEGVIVEADGYPDKLIRLVLVPNPLRLELRSGSKTIKEVWRAEES